MPTGPDSNVLLYVLLIQDEKKHEVAVSLLEKVLSSPSDYVVSVQVLAEIIYVVARKEPKALSEAIRLVELLTDALNTVHYTQKEIVLAS